MEDRSQDPDQVVAAWQCPLLRPDLPVAADVGDDEFFLAPLGERHRPGLGERRERPLAHEGHQTLDRRLDLVVGQHAVAHDVRFVDADLRAIEDRGVLVGLVRLARIGERLVLAGSLRPLLELGLPLLIAVESVVLAHESPLPPWPCVSGAGGHLARNPRPFLRPGRRRPSASRRCRSGRGRRAIGSASRSGRRGRGGRHGAGKAAAGERVGGPFAVGSEASFTLHLMLSCTHRL